MFKPKSDFSVEGLVDGIRVVVTLHAECENADATSLMNKRSVCDVHNVTTHLLVAVNHVLLQMQLDGLGLEFPPAAPAVRANNVVDFRQRLEAAKTEGEPN